MSNIEFIKKDFTAVITISRPEVLNALNGEVLSELQEVLQTIDKDRDIYALIITGAGEKAFVAGADITEMKDFNVREAREYSIKGNEVFRRIEKLRMPVIAAVNGYALGGGLELALSCDIRIGSENAVLGLPEVSLGVIPGFGGTQRLARLIGMSRAKRMIFTAEKLNAKDAFSLGLLDKVVNPDSLMDEAMAMAAVIVKNAPAAVACAKASVSRGMQCDIDTGLSLEVELFSHCFATQDQKDAMNAFVNKQKFEGFKNK